MPKHPRCARRNDGVALDFGNGSPVTSFTNLPYAPLAE
jgi:hypothetical protein